MTIKTTLTQQSDEVESLENEVADTQKSLGAELELAMLAGSQRNQSSKWEERQKSRAQEPAATCDTSQEVTAEDAPKVQKSTMVFVKMALDEAKNSPRAPQNWASEERQTKHDTVRRLNGNFPKGNSAESSVRKIQQSTTLDAFDVSPRIPRNLALALSGRSGDLSQIIRMTEVTVDPLLAEQVDADDKKTH